MKTRPQNIRIQAGDVRVLRICRNKHDVRLLIYDDDTAVPLIQAKLSAAERQAIRKALRLDK